ncbi:protein PET117 homolog, mitochondrial [Arctopsyche grandis]|uniref:protein PET117 homolog, mitochondrial n=1 Tax=Arctopsyche grandis TaxID=121162 RepID=UPI00406D8666
MSLASRITLYSACAFSAAIIGFVHYKQYSDREKLHEGVVKDVERQQRRKIENLYMLQQQAELTKQLREIERQSAALNTQNE